MNAPSNSDGLGQDAEAWQRLFASAGQLDVLAAAVQDWAPVSAADATWLTHTELPAGWQTIPTIVNSRVPLRVAAVAAEDGAGWAACQALSAFRFTGSPSPDLLYDNNDRALRALSAGGIRTHEIILPEWPGLAAVSSDGLVEINGHHVRFSYRTYLRGSDQPHHGLLVEEISATNWQVYIRLGKDLGALSSAAEDAFTARIDVTAQDMEAAVAAHGEQVRAEAARAAARGPVLSDEQRRFLWHALAMWGGPASGRPLPIEALGYTDWAEFDADVARIRAQLNDSEPHFSPLEWTRILLLAEISFASELLGAGVEFDIATPWRDPEALPVLRSIQRTLVATANASLLFPDAGRHRPHSSPPPPLQPPHG